LWKCSQCKLAHYCSNECQANDWRYAHSEECKYYQQDSESSAPIFQRDTRYRILLRAHIVAKKNPKKAEESVKTFYGPRNYWSLLNHCDKIFADSNATSRHAFHAALNFEKLGVPTNKDLFCDHFGKVQVNSFAIFAGLGVRIGSGIYIAASVFDHSCYPNATYVFDGVKMQVRAVKEFDTDKEPPVISYLNWKLSREKRLARLREQYFFDCECYRCANPHLDVDPKHLDMESQFIDLLDAGKLEAAFEIGLRLVADPCICYPYPHPSLTVLLAQLISIGVEIDDDRSESLAYMLNQTSHVTHGSDHPLIRQLLAGMYYKHLF